MDRETDIGPTNQSCATNGSQIVNHDAAKAQPPVGLNDVLLESDESVAARAQDLDGTATPQWLFDALNEQVRSLTGRTFDIDAAASPWNAKCANYYDEDTNALNKDWSQWQTVFVNPPFSAGLIGRFVEKAVDAAGKGSTVVLLLPLWPGYPWLQELKRRGQVQDVIGPVCFEHHDGTKKVLNNGRWSTSITIATLGPGVIPGTNGEPIYSPARASYSQESQPAARSSHLDRDPVFLRLSDLKPLPVEWLWSLRIPRGELTVVDGDPGSSKSSLLIDLAARVSSGREMPDGTQGSFGGVVLLMSEDSLQKTVLQRLLASEADLSRIAVPGRTVELPRDLSLLDKVAREVRANLLVVDPLAAYLGSDSSGEHRVRRALSPLKRFAETTGIAVVMVRHLVKRGGQHPLYRGAGSIGIIAATRSALLVAKAPDAPQMRVLCQSKSNLGVQAPGLLFRPVSGADGIVRIEWCGECDWTSEDLLAQPKPDDARLSEATSYLRRVLAAGPQKQQAVKAQAIATGLAVRTVERAKELLGVLSERRGFGPGSACYWRLPSEEPPGGNGGS